MTVTIISSQRFRDEMIIEEKRATADYVVTLGKVIEFDGEQFRVLVDGHHSYEAAILDGVEPEFVDSESDTEFVENLEDYLELNWIDSEYYNIKTGKHVW